jgi:hypothetical protein
MFALNPNLQSIRLSQDAIGFFGQTLIVAASYLDGIDLADKDAVIQRLVEGECRSNDMCAGDQTFRFNKDAARAFVNNYEIIRHYPNNPSGLSATLIWNKPDNQYTLAIRGAERLPAATQKEIDKDLHAVRQAMSGPMAFAQVDSAKKIVDQLRNEIPGFSRSKVILSGMDLAGHICLVLNELLPDQFGLLIVSQPIPYFVSRETETTTQK